MNKRIILNASIIFSAAAALVCALIAMRFAGDTSGKVNHLRGPVKVEKSSDGWRLTVGGQPFFVRGICYAYTPTTEGENYDMFANSKNPWVVDGALMRNMNANAVRFYKTGENDAQTKKVIRGLFERYGIKTALGNYLGFWDWPPPNYADSEFRKKIKDEVLKMVRTYRNEDGILFWVLGNENNYSFDRGVRDWTTPQIDTFDSLTAKREAKARIYYTFINDLAKSIKEIDPNHPVVMGNGELTSISVAKECTPDVDILGGIVYQGKTYGTYFKRLEKNYGKPNVFIEFGADRYDALKKEEAEDWQAFFVKLEWLEIEKNKAGGEGTGNSIGGFVFEWTDEWWKHNAGYKPGWALHDTGSNWANPAFYFDSQAKDNMNEEWFGIAGIDPQQKQAGMEKRILKKSYYVLQSLWGGGKKMTSPLIPGSMAVLFLLLSAGLTVARGRVK